MPGDAPTNTTSAGQSELMSKVELLKSPDQKLRMTILVGKYLNAEIKSFEIKEMIEAGILEKEFVPRGSGRITLGYCTQTELAAKLSDKYGRKITKMAVCRLLKKWRKAGYPWVDGLLQANNTVNISEFFAHYHELETAAGSKSVETEEEAKRRKAVHGANILARRDENEARKFSSQWMTADAFEFFCGGFGTTARNTALELSERIQRGCEGIINDNISDMAQRQLLIEKMRPVFVGKFEEWQIEFCQRLEELSKESVEMSDKQKEEMK